jgi:hypothetical protein
MITGVEGLKEIIQYQRSKSFDDSINYNLVTELDFNKIPLFASVLADVIFDQEITKWILLKGNRIENFPGYNVTIIIPELGKRKEKMLKKKFWKRMRELILHSEMGEFIKNSISQGMKSAPTLPDPLIKYNLLRVSMKSWSKDITTNLKKNIQIHS